MTKKLTISTKTSSPSKGLWKKGVSGNPSGRPPGSRNKATEVMEQLLEGESERLIRKAIELALKGNPIALRLCVERLLPVCKERRIQLDLKEVPNPTDLPLDYSDVIVAVAEGRITPGEGSSLAGILTAHICNIEPADLARRVQELESHLDKVQHFNRNRSSILSEAVREP